MRKVSPVSSFTTSTRQTDSRVYKQRQPGQRGRRRRAQERRGGTAHEHRLTRNRAVWSTAEEQNSRIEETDKGEDTQQRV
jgi:hypothetical protein